MPSKIKTPWLLLCLMQVFSSQAQELPPILDYYPGCDYQVLELLVEKGSVSMAETQEYLNREYEQDLKKILAKLQNSAAEVGADALIITDLTKSRRVKDRELSEVNRETVLQYSAEAIKYCTREDKSLRRQSSIDHNGFKGHTLKLNQIKTQFDVAMVIREMATLQSFVDGQDISPIQFKEKAVLKNKDISLSGSIYGLTLGASRAQVVQEFGYPSAEFKLFTGIESLLYGRRHWLHFKQNKLISVEFTDQLLSYESLNLIAALDEFDQFEWLIEDKIKLNTAIENARDIFKDKSMKEDGKYLTIDEHGVQLSLIFDTEYDPFNKINKKFLVGFTLKDSDTPIFNASLPPSAPLNLQQLIDVAKVGQAADLDKLMSSLPQPVGRIFVDHNTYFDIFDNHILLKYNSLKMAQLSMREEIFKAHRIQMPKVKWKATEFIFEGAKVKDIRQHYGDDFSLMFGKGSINYPQLNIHLMFDGDDDSSRLYAGDFIFFSL